MACVSLVRGNLSDWQMLEYIVDCLSCCAALPCMLVIYGDLFHDFQHISLRRRFADDENAGAMQGREFMKTLTRNWRGTKGLSGFSFALAVTSIGCAVPGVSDASTTAAAKPAIAPACNAWAVAEWV
jgi:hypothetical protein